MDCSLSSLLCRNLSHGVRCMNIANTIIKIQNPATQKRQFFITSKKLYNLINPDVSYKTFVETNIIWSKLRENIDYHYNETHDTYNLSISAVQAVLILENTEKSWMLFNQLSDLINMGFASLTSINNQKVGKR